MASDRCSSHVSNGPGAAPACERRASALRPVRVARADHAEQQVGVAGQRLGRAVYRDVGAQVERLLAERRGERVVDRQAGARGVRGLGHGGDVADVEARVGRRLDPDERGARGTRPRSPRCRSARSAPRRRAGRAAPPRSRGCRDSRRGRPRARRRRRARARAARTARPCPKRRRRPRRPRARPARASAALQVGLPSRT